MKSNLKKPLYDKWEFNTVCVSGNNVDTYNILNDNDIQIILNNVNNQQSCFDTKSFCGANIRYPVGTYKVLYANKISELILKANIEVGINSTIFENVNNPWSVAIIGIPMYDELSKRNLWLEICPYWTCYSDFIVDNTILFHGESQIEELYRINIDNYSIIPGKKRNYSIDVIKIINSLSWGEKYNINWDYVHIGDSIYFGIETWDMTNTDIRIYNVDLLYTEEPKEDIFKYILPLGLGIGLLSMIKK